jgi:hypothetical protein
MAVFIYSGLIVSFSYKIHGLLQKGIHNAYLGHGRILLWAAQNQLAGRM